MLRLQVLRLWIQLVFFHVLFVQQGLTPVAFPPFVCVNFPYHAIRVERIYFTFFHCRMQRPSSC